MINIGNLETFTDCLTQIQKHKRKSTCVECYDSQRPSANLVNIICYFGKFNANHVSSEWNLQKLGWFNSYNKPEYNTITRKREVAKDRKKIVCIYTFLSRLISLALFISTELYPRENRKLGNSRWKVRETWMW